jgi:DNA-binding transcriptional ArsR family regulator
MLSRQKEICEIEYVDKAKVNTLKKQMLKNEEINKLCEVFGILSDPTRIKIIFALSRKELCVCDISNLFNISISATSHQLRILRNTRLVKYRKEGKRVFYSLDDKHISNLFNEGLKHIKE